MSTAGGKKGGGGAKKKASTGAAAATDEAPKTQPSTTKPPTTAEEPSKEGSPPLSEKKDSRGEEATPPKPQSAGVTARDGAQKLLNLAMKGEWTGVDAVIKSLEKAVANAGEEGNTQPLNGVMDHVSTCISKPKS